MRSRPISVGVSLLLGCSSALPDAPTTPVHRDPIVISTSSGGFVERVWLGDEAPLDLLGRAYSADMQPAGRVELEGAPRARELHEVGSTTRALTSAFEVGVAMSRFGYGWASPDGQRIILHEAHVDLRRYDLAPSADFGQLDPSARYYVSSVSQGRALAIACLGTFDDDLERPADYATIVATPSSSIDCRSHGLGMAEPALASGGAPTADELVALVASSSSEGAATTHVTLRRIPRLVTGPLPEPQVTITRLTVDAAACGDPDLVRGVAAPDLALSVTLDAGEPQIIQCPDDRSTCTLSIPLARGQRSVVVSASDRDVFSADVCGSASFDVSSWWPADPDALAPDPADGELRSGALRLRYAVTY